MKTLFFLIIFSKCICQTSIIQAQAFLIDDFDKIPINFGKKSLTYVSTQIGYDIYYQNATIQLSLVKINPNNISTKALQIDFRLPPVQWLAVRREFESPMNLENYKGLELFIRVDVPSPNVLLRITLSDLQDEKEGDEMWWFDHDRSLLKNKIQNWTQIRMPFDGFYLSHGGGTRQNDHKKNLRKIIAYEINLISEFHSSINGVIVLDSFRAYK